MQRRNLQMNEETKESINERRNLRRNEEVKLILTASSVAAARTVLLLIRYQWCEINPNCQQRSCRTYRACVDSKFLEEEYVNHGNN